MSAVPDAPSDAWADTLVDSRAAPASWRLLPRRIVTLCWVELRKLRHDRTELYTRAIQPALWLLIFGKTFTRLRAIPTGNVPYLAYLAPGILAQSALFIAIFYGIQIIWERDAGVLAKLLVTPIPRTALVAGKPFAAGIRAMSQVVVVLVLSMLLGVTLTDNPVRILGTIALVLLGAAFFSCLSMVIAGVVLSRERLAWARPSRCRSSSAPTPCTPWRSCPGGSGSSARRPSSDGWPGDRPRRAL
jgi:ABC-2 type transport system permease protein